MLMDLRVTKVDMEDLSKGGEAISGNVGIDGAKMVLLESGIDGFKMVTLESVRGGTKDSCGVVVYVIGGVSADTLLLRNNSLEVFLRRLIIIPVMLFLGEISMYLIDTSTAIFERSEDNRIAFSRK
jgi:hypothetical protein